MTNLMDLSSMESEDQELVPEIVPYDARASFEGDVSVLLSLFQSAQDIVPAKEIIPNTGYMYLEAFPTSPESVGHINIEATDGERSIRVVSDDVQIRLGGGGLLPGKRIIEILKLAPANRARIDMYGTNASVRSGRALWNVSIPPAGVHLPEFTDVSEITTVGVSRKEFLRALELIYPAVSKSSSRQSLMQAEFIGGKLIACDGIRAHKVSVSGVDSTIHTTLPLKFIETAIRQMRLSKAETVEIGATASAVMIDLGQERLSSQKLNFEFPKVEHLVIGPAISNEEILTFNTKDLIETVKRVRVNSDPDYFAIALSLRHSGDQWTLSVSSRDKHGNSSQETLPVTFEGPVTPKNIIVNHRHLLEFLECLPDDKGTLRLGENTKTKQAPIYASQGIFEGVLMTMAPNVVRA